MKQVGQILVSGSVVRRGLDAGAFAAVELRAVVLRAVVLRAVLVRVASSHLRVGTFQFVTGSLRDPGLLRRLLDHAIARHHPHAAEAESPALALFEEGVTRLRAARDRLAAAELKVQAVLDQAGGDLRYTDFDG